MSGRFNTNEYRRQCRDQDVSWLLREREKCIGMSASTSGVTGIGIALAPFTLGLSLVGPAISAARIRSALIKLEIIEKELQERQLQEQVLQERFLQELYVSSRSSSIRSLVQNGQDRKARSPRGSPSISKSAKEESKTSQSTAHIAQTRSFGADLTLGYDLGPASGTLVKEEFKINQEVTKDMERVKISIAKPNPNEKDSGDVSSRESEAAIFHQQAQPNLIRWSQKEIEDSPSTSHIIPIDDSALLGYYADQDLPLAETIPAPIRPQQPSLSSIKVDDSDAKKQPTLLDSTKGFNVPSATERGSKLARVELDSGAPSKKRATGRGALSIWLAERLLVAVTAVFVVVHFLVYIFGKGFTFRTSAISYSILILVTTFLQNRSEQAQAVSSPGTNKRLPRAIVFILLDFLQFVIFHTTLNMFDTAGLIAEAGSVVGKSISVALSSVSPEAPLPTGMVRIRWICKCGMKLYDDYQELEIGAASDLRQQILGVSTVGTRQDYISRGEEDKAVGSVTNTTPGQSEPPLQSFDAQSMEPQSADTPQQASVSSNPADIADTNELGFQNTTTRELYLLSCIDQGRYSTTLTHVDVQQTKSDHELMLKVKEVVNQRSQLPLWLLLRTVSSINFISFELHRKQLVDIRKGDDIPPESLKDEYDYVPMPAKLIPPIGRNYLMHTYHYPEDADNYTLCLDRFPKRKTGRLQHTDGRPVPGWGIHFASGLDQTKLCIIGLFCTVCSASFGIIWSVFRDDVQGGFGVSAYMMALLVFGMGSIQTFVR